jgi:hypothetical protein
MPDAASLTRLLHRLPLPGRLVLLGGAGIPAGQIGGGPGFLASLLTLPPALATGCALAGLSRAADSRMPPPTFSTATGWWPMSTARWSRRGVATDAPPS